MVGWWQTRLQQDCTLMPTTHARETDVAQLCTHPYMAHVHLTDFTNPTSDLFTRRPPTAHAQRNPTCWHLSCAATPRAQSLSMGMDHLQVKTDEGGIRICFR